jgi:hypothetical protein
MRDDAFWQSGRPSFEAVVRRLVEIEDSQPDYTRLHWTDAKGLVGQGYIGLLVLEVGVANKGIDWSGWPLATPDDPAGMDWRGPSEGKGKRWRDYREGGFSIAHADSGFLLDIYDTFGPPPGIPSNVIGSWSFDQIRNDDRYREKWRDWAGPLVHQHDVLLWVARKWLAEYWQPAWDVYLFDYRSSQQGVDDWADFILNVAMNARVSNSVKGIGKRLRGGYGNQPMGWREQEREYVEYKRSARGDSSAERAQRQVAQVLRVGALVKALRLHPAD